jgi:hypothetical protein
MVDFFSDGNDMSVLSLTSFYDTEGSLLVSLNYVCNLELFIFSVYLCEIFSLSYVGRVFYEASVFSLNWVSLLSDFIDKELLDLILLLDKLDKDYFY